MKLVDRIISLVQNIGIIIIMSIRTVIQLKTVFGSFTKPQNIIFYTFHFNLYYINSLKQLLKIQQKYFRPNLKFKNKRHI